MIFEFRICRSHNELWYKTIVHCVCVFHQHIKMEWCGNEIRIDLHYIKQVRNQIQFLKSSICRAADINNPVNKHLTHRYNGNSSVCGRKGAGHPHSVFTKRVIKAVRDRIRRNPIRKRFYLERWRQHLEPCRGF